MPYTMLIMADGSAKGVGTNSYGGIGNGSTATNVTAFASSIGIANVKQIAVGDLHTVFF